MSFHLQQLLIKLKKDTYFIVGKENDQSEQIFAYP